MRGKQNQKNSAKNFMKQEIIDKLPPDAQKEFLKLAMKLDEKTKQEKVHNDCLTNVKKSLWTFSCFVFSSIFIASFKNSFCASGGSLSMISCFI